MGTFPLAPRNRFAFPLVKGAKETIMATQPMPEPPAQPTQPPTELPPTGPDVDVPDPGAPAGNPAPAQPSQELVA